MSTWTAGPSKGLLAAAQSGELPPFMHKVNKHDMPIGLLVFQGVIVSLLSLVFLLMPDVSASFWMLLVLTSQLYIIVYLLMFVSFIILRYKKPNVKRAYQVPGKKVGMWIVAGLGLLASLGSFFIGFFPPEQLNTGSLLFYEIFMVSGIIIACAMPFIILAFKKPSWDKP